MKGIDSPEELAAYFDVHERRSLVECWDDSGEATGYHRALDTATLRVFRVWGVAEETEGARGLTAYGREVRAAADAVPYAVERRRLHGLPDDANDARELRCLRQLMAREAALRDRADELQEKVLGLVEDCFTVEDIVAFAQDAQGR